MFSQRQQGRGDWASWMDDGFEMRVIKIKGVGGDAVNQGGTGHVNFFQPSQHAGLGCWLQHLDGGQGCVGGFMSGCANRAAQPVHPSAVGF